MQKTPLPKRLFVKDTFKRAWFLMKYHDPGKGVKSIEKEDYPAFCLGLLLLILAIAIAYFVISGIESLLKSR